MRELTDVVWQMMGTSWIWDENALSQIASPEEIISLRKFKSLSNSYPEVLPSNGGRTLVVSGFDASLDVLPPSEATEWLETEIKELVLSFQDYYLDETALIFWIPNGESRFEIETTTHEVKWVCCPPNQNLRIDLGRILWGVSSDYPKKILLGGEHKYIGLYHARIT